MILSSVTQCKSGEMRVGLLLFSNTKTSCPRLQHHLSNTLYSLQACRLGNKTGSEEPFSLFEIYFTDLWNAFFRIKSIAALKKKYHHASRKKHFVSLRQRHGCEFQASKGHWDSREVMSCLGCPPEPEVLLWAAFLSKYKVSGQLMTSAEVLKHQ